MSKKYSIYLLTQTVQQQEKMFLILLAQSYFLSVRLNPIHIALNIWF